MKRASLGTCIITLVSIAAAAQTSTDPGIDIELIEPTTGGNALCAGQPGHELSVLVWVRPGSTPATCELPCGEAQGGSSQLAFGVLDIQLDPTRLAVVGVERNPENAAKDALITVRPTEGRVGLALAGDFSPDADPTGAISDRCTMGTLAMPDWLVRIDLQVLSVGGGRLHVRTTDDRAPFPLAFADVCGLVFRGNGNGIDELVDAVVLTGCIDPSEILFYDGQESGDLSRWSSSAG